MGNCQIDNHQRWCYRSSNGLVHIQRDRWCAIKNIAGDSTDPAFICCWQEEEPSTTVCIILPFRKYAIQLCSVGWIPCDYNFPTSARCQTLQKALEISRSKVWVSPKCSITCVTYPNRSTRSVASKILPIPWDVVILQVCEQLVTNHPSQYLWECVCDGYGVIVGKIGPPS